MNPTYEAPIKSSIKRRAKGCLSDPFHSRKYFCCMRPKAKDLGITWFVVVVFFVWSKHYQLPPPCYPQFLKKILKISLYLSLFLYIYHYLCLSIYQSLSVNLSIDILSLQTHEPVSVLLILKLNHCYHEMCKSSCSVP